MSIRTLRTQFLEGTYTPLNAFESATKVITERDDDIHAFLHVYDDARQAAEDATKRYQEEGESAPMLLGVPVAVKNNILIKGKPATAGSKILENYVAPYDATVIARMKAQAPTIMGDTNLDEFALGSSTENSAFGPTKNPHDTTRVPGGTSGGSAAAVAMGAAVVALGTDTGGSIRQPASFCGLVGMKPTYGMVSRSGLVASGSSLDQAGMLAKTVDDAEILFDAVAGHDPLDSTTIHPDTYPTVSIKETYRIGIPRDFIREGLDPAVLARFTETIDALIKDGHEVVDIALPLFEKGLAAYYIVQPAELSSNLSRYDGMRFGLRVEGENLLDEYRKTRAAGFGPEVKRRIILGTYVLSAGYYDAYYGKAEAVRRMMREELIDVYRSVDLIMTPTAPTPAYKLGEKSDPLAMYLGDIYTVPVSLAGVPAISLPAGTSVVDGKELPIGMQFIAPWAGDKRLFDFGKKFHDRL
jgi:aspartyl-tRNA(Asn)/glutamyl-tRNA(Gln) amidotransferase subunit A